MEPTSCLGGGGGGEMFSDISNRWEGGGGERYCPGWDVNMSRGGLLCKSKVIIMKKLNRIATIFRNKASHKTPPFPLHSTHTVVVVASTYLEELGNLSLVLGNSYIDVAVICNVVASFWTVCGINATRNCSWLCACVHTIACARMRVCVCVKRYVCRGMCM